MAIRRLSFTAEPRGAGGTYEPADPAMDDRALDRMAPLLEAACARPETFCYSRFPDGRALIARSLRRTAHALYLEAGTAELAGRLPIDLADSPIWSPWSETGPAAPDPGMTPAPTVLADLANQLHKDGGRLERLLTDVRALYAPRPGRQLVLVARDGRAVTRAIQLACASLPRILAARLTFTTDSDDPRIGFQQIIGTRIDQHIEFTPEEMAHQYRVHDLTGGGQDSPASARPDAWARAVVRQWLTTGMTPEHAERLWDPVFDEPSVRSEGAESVAGAMPEADTARRLEIHNPPDPLAEHGSWPAPPVHLPPTIAASSRLAERLIADNPAAERCAELIAEMSDIPLRTKELHRLDELSAADPHHVRTTRGFKALVRALPLQKVPTDLAHLRILMAAERAPLPEPGLWPDANTVVRLVEPAIAARQPDGPSPLRTALAMWRTPSDPVPAKLVLEMTDALISRYPEYFKAEDVLDLFVDTALRAPVHDQNVATLIGWLRTQPLRSAQQDAIDVYFRARSLGSTTTDKQTFVAQLDEIGSALRGAERVPFSPAVRQVWVDSVLDALFDAERPGLWFEVVPSLVQCPDEHLIREYGARVRARQRMRATSRERLLLANAVAEWMLARPTTEYWRQERAELLKWAFPDRAESEYAATLQTVLTRKVPDEHVRHECGYW